MKLHLSILEKLIELPSGGSEELRQVLDDLGLEVKGLEDSNGRPVFNIETLANRGDHLYALGVAREFSARYLTALKVPPMAAELVEKNPSLMVRNQTDKCLRYALLEMTLPAGMKLRPDIAQIMDAAAAADRHPVVHLLNYILLELGQPMHAFDRDKVEGEIIVRVSEAEEEVLALDGKTYKVPPQSLVICDRRKTIAVAGVIGLANSMVTAQTTRTLIESALFDPVSVRKTARAMGLSTDASYAFERGGDRETVITALKRLVYLCEGGAVKDTESAHALGFVCIEGPSEARRKISLRLSTIRRELNAPRLEELEVQARLKNLGYAVEAGAVQKGSDRELVIGVPSWRIWDVFSEEDLVEDFARAHGLNRIRLDLPALDYEQAEANPADILLEKLERPLLGNGFYEVITRGSYSGEDADLICSLAPAFGGQHLVLKNAVDSGFARMKVTNILHLARLSAANLKRGLHSFKVYEFARLFSLRPQEGQQYDFERDVLSLAAAGRWYEHDYGKPESLEEQFSLFKGVLEGIFSQLGQRLRVLPGSNQLLHPGMQGVLACGRINCGFFGLIHPRLRQELELRHDLIYAELEASQLFRLIRPGQYEPQVDLPAVRRDITLKIPAAMHAGRVIEAVESLKQPDLRQVVIADHFVKAGEEFRRVTYRLTFQNAQRTLEHGEVDAFMEEILKHLREKHSLELAL